MKDVLVWQEVADVSNVAVLAEGDVEFSATVETTEAVVAGAVQVVKKACGGLAVAFLLGEEPVEPTPVAVVKSFFVLHGDIDYKTFLEAPVEIYKVRVDIVQEGP